MIFILFFLCHIVSSIKNRESMMIIRNFFNDKPLNSNEDDIVLFYLTNDLMKESILQEDERIDLTLYHYHCIESGLDKEHCDMLVEKNKIAHLIYRRMEKLIDKNEYNTPLHIILQRLYTLLYEKGLDKIVNNQFRHIIINDAKFSIIQE